MRDPARRDGLLWRRPVTEMVADGTAHGYQRALGAVDLAGIGIAGIVGAGIFVVLGVVARDVAGPAVMLSVVLAGVASALTALTFAEIAAMVPSSGGMYEYTYATLGRLPAFVVGWSVLMGYIVGNFAVAQGWSAFLDGLVGFPNTGIGRDLVTVPSEGGILDLPAAVAMAVVTLLCLPRVRSSTLINNALVILKLLVVALVVVVGFVILDPANWRPFAPFGIQGVISGAALMMFAYFGFDTVAAAGAEARQPQRTLPIGIVGSVAAAGILYVGMGAVVTGVRPIATLTSDTPLLEAFAVAGIPLARLIITFGALVALTTVMYAYVLATARIMQTMAAGGFLPDFLARVHPTTGTPWAATLVTGGAMVIGAGFLELGLAVAATVAASGTAYILVVVGVIVLRRTDPHADRPFRVRIWVAIAAAIVLIVIIGRGLSPSIIAAYLAWVGLGLVWYGVGAHKRSVARSASPESTGT